MSSRGLPPIGRPIIEFKGAVCVNLPAQTRQHSVLEIEKESNQAAALGDEYLSVPDVQKCLCLGRIRI